MHGKKGSYICLCSKKKKVHHNQGLKNHWNLLKKSLKTGQYSWFSIKPVKKPIGVSGKTSLVTVATRFPFGSCHKSDCFWERKTGTVAVFSIRDHNLSSNFFPWRQQKHSIQYVAIRRIYLSITATHCVVYWCMRAKIWTPCSFKIKVSIFRLKDWVSRQIAWAFSFKHFLSSSERLAQVIFRGQMLESIILNR
jgi:hypothetical protein